MAIVKPSSMPRLSLLTEPSATPLAESAPPPALPPIRLSAAVTGLRCMICGHVYGPQQVGMVCTRHGNEGVLDVEYDYDRLRADFGTDWQAALGQCDNGGMWRFRALMPLAADAEIPMLQVGDTPLYRAKHLAGLLGLKELWIKDEGREPTGSLKDRASALAVAMARSAGIRSVATASTGNAAAALAGMSAGFGIKPIIFVPAAILSAKVAQLLVYGAKVVLVDGTYDQAFDLCMDASTHFGWYNRNTGYNPYMTEGKKTVAYEIVEQLNKAGKDLQEIDTIVVSAGDGCILGAVHEGFRDMLALGWVTRIPKIIGVQAAGSDYLYQVWKENGDVLDAPPIETSGIADSLMAGLPRDRLKAMAAVTQTGGAFVRVRDVEILAAIPELARLTGVFAEPAAAAAYAGLIQALNQNLIGQGERVAIISTGTGLKDIASAINSVAHEASSRIRCEPTLASFRQVWN